MIDDRRTRRTKRALKQALIALVLERGFDKVTVEDILDNADVSRATFYKHHRDKQALLLSIVKDLQEELSRRSHASALAATQGFSGQPALELFRHALEERDAYLIILRGEGNGIALRSFVELRTERARSIFVERAKNLGTTMRIDAEVLARAWVGEQVAVLSWWLEQPDPLPPEQVSHMLLELSLRGRFWASGFDEPPSPDATVAPGREHLLRQ